MDPEISRAPGHGPRRVGLHAAELPAGAAGIFSLASTKSVAEQPLRAWEKLQRDDFRGYLRFLGRQNLGRAAIQLRFCALRTFYKFLIRHGVVEASPIKNLALPKPGRRLPKYLTRQQMLDLLGAPVKLMATPRRKGPGRPISASVCLRDVAVLETIYSCGLRVSELCGLRVEDIDWSGATGARARQGKKGAARADWRAGVAGD